MELKVKDFIPDVLVEINDKRLAIEICVTHNVDDQKLKKVEAENIDMLEIYLNPEYIDNKRENKDFDLDEYILFEAERRWIHKTSSHFFNEKIKRIIYNEGIPLINEEYTDKQIMKRSKPFLVCPKCGGNIIGKTSQYGFYYACSNYPKCSFVKNRLYDIKCPKCGKTMELLKGKYGYFWGHRYEVFPNNINDCNFKRDVKSTERFLIDFYYG